MDKDNKVDIIIKLLENKVFDTVNKSMTQVDFAKLLGYKTRSSLQRVLEKKAGPKAVDELWNRLSNMDKMGNEGYLKYVAVLKDDYERLIDVLKTDQDVFDWVAEFWWNGRMSARDKKIVLSFPKDNDYIGMLLAYSFYRQDPGKYKTLKLYELKSLFADSLAEKYRTFDTDVFKNIKINDVDDCDFSIYSFCVIFGISLTRIKTLTAKEVAERLFENDTYWIDPLSSSKHTDQNFFYILKDLGDGAYFIIKSTIKDNQEPDFDFPGYVGITKINGISLFALNNGEKVDSYIMFMDGRDEINLQTIDGKLFKKLQRIDINSNDNVIEDWIYKIREIVTSPDIENKIVSGMLSVLKKMGIEYQERYAITQCIKTSDYLFYKLLDISEEYWIKIELAVYPELNVIQPSDEAYIIKAGDSFMMKWPDASLHLKIDNLEKNTNTDIIDFLNLDM